MTSSIVDRFVATVEKGKSVGRAPVNEEIVEDLLQRMEQKLKKNPSGSYHFRLMYR
jgi:cytochrome c-type biogenesis protein CcmH/NrfG